MHHWCQRLEEPWTSKEEVDICRVDFNPTLFICLITHSKPIQEHPLSTGRMLWTKYKGVTDRMQICAEKFQGEHIFIFKSSVAKWNNQLKSFFYIWNYSFDWFPFTEMNVFYSIKLIAYLGSTPPLVINTNIS